MSLGVRGSQGDGTRRPVLSIQNLVLTAGSHVAITGPSGAGKSTLLGALSGVVKPDTGIVLWGGTDLGSLPESARDRWRRQNIGLVFQDFHLIPELGVLGNVLLPATFGAFRPSRSLRHRAEALLARCGLTDLRRPAALLSRGERQRAAIARALLHQPGIILADEPTASLDGDNGRAVIDLLVGTAQQSGATLVCATHDPALIARLRTRWTMFAGRIASPGEHE